jgi:hypothetical protein
MDIAKAGPRSLAAAVTQGDNMNLDMNPLNENGARTKQSEGRVARTIESQTSRIPSDLFLWGSLASIGTSLVFMAVGKKQVATFVGQWVPTLLLLGVYNKILKVAGHDRASS